MTPMYKAVVQAVLLYGAEMWVLTGAMEKALSTSKFSLKMCTIHNWKAH
jgi:hypothetical protein